MASFELLSTVRVGQLTGSVGGDWKQPVDAEGWPLLTNTTDWGVVGVDLGATAEHSGRLYIFFGDVATNQRPGDPRLNTDMVAWTDDDRVVGHGGHLPVGLEFVLPFEPTAIVGQPQWRYCLSCASLFWDGDPSFKGVCPRGGIHSAFNVGEKFVIPFEPTSQPGQPEWSLCRKCGSMFWNGGDPPKGCCPADFEPHSASVLRFVLPFTTQSPPPGEGQPKWRFCANCRGLFWDGYPDKGVCAGARGGGFRLNTVLRPDGQFEPFTAPEPINFTESLETPNGAFSHGARAYVFAGIAEQRYSRVRRKGDPAVGQYLFSKINPSHHGTYDIEFLFSPKLGWCAKDPSRRAFLGHHVLGLRFVLPHNLPASAGQRERGWRSCKQCEALFWNGDSGFKGVCQRGGPHQAHDERPEDYALEFGIAGDAQNQEQWRRCRKCLALFWNGSSPDTGLCPTSGVHEPEMNGANLRVPHISIEEDANNQRDWRFCRKCSGLFFDGSPDKGICPLDHLPHVAQGFNFVVPHDLPEDATHQSFWRFCLKCTSMFFDGFDDKGCCPRDGGAHQPAGHVFRLPHDEPESFDRQSNWHFCTKCAGLFFGGERAGCCPRDTREHQAAGFVMTLPHNPGADGNNRDNWRFCTRCHGMVRTDQGTHFPWLSPWKVDNKDHPVLRPQHRVGRGLMMVGFDWFNFRLAWMPLTDGQPPDFASTLYYHAGKNEWADTPDNSAGYGLFEHPYSKPRDVALPPPINYTHVSAMWLADIGYWIVVYATAWDKANRFDTPIEARFSKDLRRWTQPVRLFSPKDADAYDRYMHLPRSHGGILDIHPKLPPPQPPPEDNPGWAYGAFLIERFTDFGREPGILSLHYLLSFGSPYQVQLMHSRLRVRESIPDIHTFARERLNRSAQLSAGGRLADATAAAREAADALHGVEPSPDGAAEHWTLFGASLHAYALRLMEDHRVEDALMPAAEAVSVYRQAAASAGADVPSIAGQLLTLSVQLSANGRLAEAVAPTQGAVDVVRGVASEPDASAAHRMLFAVSLHTLSLRLFDAKRADEAVAPAQEAGGAYRRAATAAGADVPYIAGQLLSSVRTVVGQWPPGRGRGSSTECSRRAPRNGVGARRGRRAPRAVRGVTSYARAAVVRCQAGG